MQDHKLIMFLVLLAFIRSLVGRMQSVSYFGNRNGW